MQQLLDGRNQSGRTDGRTETHRTRRKPGIKLPNNKKTVGGAIASFPASVWHAGGFDWDQTIEAFLGLSSTNFIYIDNIFWMHPPRPRIMLFLSLFLILPILTSAYGQRIPASEEKKTGARRQGSSRETPSLPPRYLRLPVFVDSKTLMVKEQFSPTSGTGREPLPGQVREILLPLQDRIKSDSPGDSTVSIKVSCRQKTMQVRVHRSVFSTGPHLQVKLGTCQPSKYTEDHLYFEYDIGMCGTKRTVSSNVQSW